MRETDDELKKELEEEQEAKEILNFLKKTKKHKNLSKWFLNKVKKFIKEAKNITADLLNEVKERFKEVREDKEGFRQDVQETELVLTQEQDTVLKAKQEAEQQEILAEQELKEEELNAILENENGLFIDKEEIVFFHSLISSNKDLSQRGVVEVKKSYDALEDMHEEGLIDKSILGDSEESKERAAKLISENPEILKQKNTELWAKDFAIKFIEGENNPDFVADLEYLSKEHSEIEDQIIKLLGFEDLKEGSVIEKIEYDENADDVENEKAQNAEILRMGIKRGIITRFKLPDENESHLSDLEKMIKEMEVIRKEQKISTYKQRKSETAKESLGNIKSADPKTKQGSGPAKPKKLEKPKEKELVTF